MECSKPDTGTGSHRFIDRIFTWFVISNRWIGCQPEGKDHPYHAVAGDMDAAGVHPNLPAVQPAATLLDWAWHPGGDIGDDWHRTSETRADKTVGDYIYIYMHAAHPDRDHTYWGLNAVSQHNPRMVIYKAEENAMAWINTHTDMDAIILASPDIGMFIPAHTGRRVIYGHPFETTFATEKEQEIISFYSGNWDAAKAEEYLAENHITYIFWGPREHALGEPAYLEALPVIFSSGDVEILASGTSK